MSVDLSRLLRPASIAVFGGVWARNVVEQCQRSGYKGSIWPVHPQAADMHGIACINAIDRLPGVPDAAFVGVNRETTIDVVRHLRDIGCGGVVCFASGFSEAQAEDSRGVELEHALAEAAGAMPLIGPNCYGLLNYADGAMLWPDQHGGAPCESGVALVTQSSNIAINLTMQQRGLPIVYALTAGNQLQLSIGELGQALLSDERVTALGMYIESVGSIRDFENLATLAHQTGKPIVVIKAGRSTSAQSAMLSHTNSLAGNDAASDAFFKRLGILRVDSPAVMLETLKILHVCGPLAGNRLQSMSCSGGEAALIADTADSLQLAFPVLEARQHDALREALGPQVALANPLDYHTYIWDDSSAMQATFTAMMQGVADMTLLVLDFPRADRCDATSWYSAVDALSAAAHSADRPAAVLSTLPENISENDAAYILKAGLVPLAGFQDALLAIEACSSFASVAAAFEPLFLPGLPPRASDVPSTVRTLPEVEAKRLLERAGILLPGNVSLSVESGRLPERQQIDQICTDLHYPLVLKIQSIDKRAIEHKSDIGGVVLNIPDADSLYRALSDMHQRLSGDIYLIEEQIDRPLAELLVSVVRDPVYGFMLTVAAGGTHTELLQDSRQLLLPASRDDIRNSIKSLRVAPQLVGFRGGPAVDIEQVINAVDHLQRFAMTHADGLHEVEINPLLCTEHRVIATDCLLRLSPVN